MDQNGTAKKTSLDLAISHSPPPSAATAKFITSDWLGNVTYGTAPPGIRQSGRGSTRDRHQVMDLRTTQTHQPLVMGANKKHNDRRCHQ
jgi:hypothetical protein